MLSSQWMVWTSRQAENTRDPRSVSTPLPPPPPILTAFRKLMVNGWQSLIYTFKSGSQHFKPCYSFSVFCIWWLATGVSCLSAGVNLLGKSAPLKHWAHSGIIGAHLLHGPRYIYSFLTGIIATVSCQTCLLCHQRVLTPSQYRFFSQLFAASSLW